MVQHQQKESTEEFIFTFDEWIPEITKVESEQTYTQEGIYFIEGTFQLTKEVRNLFNGKH